MAKALATVAILGSTLGACADAAPSPTPTIEYRTPVPTSAFLRPANPSVVMTLTPPTATEVAETPTPFSLPPTEAPPTPQVFKPATTVPTTFQVSGQSLEKPTAVVRENRTTAYAGQCGWDFSTTTTRWWPVITQYDWDPCGVLRIIQRESRGLNVWNYEGSGACGVMQLLPCQYPNDGAANIAAGYQKYLDAIAYWGNGWHPWGLN